MVCLTRASIKKGAKGLYSFSFWDPRRGHPRGAIKTRCRGRPRPSGPSRRPAAARNEHHLRDHEGAGRNHPDSDLDGRQPKSGDHSRAGQPEGGAHGEGGLMARAAEDRILVTAWDRPADRGVDMDPSGSWIRV